MTKFSDLKLDPKVLTAIADAGYETPTPIQAGAIPPALEGKDVLGIAQTGTGKTASFTLPMITLLGRGRARARMPRSLVLCPTRELAAQVAENFDTYAKHTKLTKALLIGGVSFAEQDKLIDRGVDVLIATPGRLLDHFERGKLLLTGVQIMVVDEADRMLDMGFIPDIERIFQLTPFTRQTLFFSATMAPEIERITNTFLHSPARIEVARQATTSETITQRLVQITPTRRDQTAKQKRELLRAVIDAEGPGLKNAIIFCNRKTDVDIVAKSLKKHGYDAAPIYGDLDQSQRMRTLDEFRDGKLRFLVASDVAARGLDIPAVSHVFNFDLPSHAEDYVHRIGRTGRAGREGTAISLGTPADEKYLTAIENLVKQTLPRGEVPAEFSLSETATSAPRSRDGRDGRDDRKGRSRGRSRRGSDGPDRNADRGADRGMERGADRAAAPANEKPASDRRDNRRDDQIVDQAIDRMQEDRRPPRGDDRRPGHDRQADRKDDRRDDRARDDRRDERRRDDRRDDRRRDHAVVGMGDHVPEFMTNSFRPSIAATAETAMPDEMIEEAAQVAVDVEVKAEPKAEVTKKPARARRSKTKDSGRAATKTAEASTESPSELPAAASQTPVEAPVAAAAPDMPAEAAAATVSATAEAPEKPKRARRKATPKADKAEAAPKTKAKAKAADTAATDDAAPAKPKRASRKKAVAAPVEPAQDQP